VDLTTSTVQTAAVGRFPSGIDVNAAGTAVYIPSRDDGTVAILNTATNAVQTISVGGKPIPGSHDFITPEDAGIVPADRPSLRCENAAATKLTTLVTRVIKCHMKAARKVVAKAKFDEEACETAAKAAFDAAIGTPAKCPCVAENAAALRDVVESFLDVTNGKLYCAGPRAFEP
jgi:YVTN family beta-propeller protein